MLALKRTSSLTYNKISFIAGERASLVGSVESKLPAFIYNPKSTRALDYILKFQNGLQ